MKYLSSRSSCVRLLAAVILSGWAIAATPASSSAQTIINSVPYTINTSGKYKLGGNLNNTNIGSGAIYITVANVILDLDGYYVSNTPNTPGSAFPVIEVENVANVTIRNGTVANAGYGIALNGGSNARGYQIENVNVLRCYYTGIYFSTAAPGSVVSRCSFSKIGGSSYADDHPSAIYANGGVRIENNAVSTVTASASGQTGYGIRAGGADLAIGNTVYDATIGIRMTSLGKYLDNLTANCATPFSNGVGATGNN